MTPATLIAILLATQTIDVPDAARRPDASRLAAYHELLASEPHVAGTPGDARTIERLRAAFEEIGKGLSGWTVEVQQFYPLLARPVKARLEIVGVELGTPSSADPSARRGVLALPVTEPNLAIDPATAHPDLDIAWNAWSGSGTVEAGVVYVNYGGREDFEQLARLGIDPRGKIALARYGGNFRGYKAKFAEAAGCVGLVIFTDPADAGSAKGKTWPDGGTWANAECVQRGSLITLPYIGDPLTPGREATKDAARVAVESLALPRIPVQPVGYGAAREILSRMKGAESPKEWRGGLPCDYHLDDAELRLRLEVEQVRAITPTANVVARLEGATLPRESVIVGSHHDAWCFGAADPLAGTICMLEAARNFADLARAGKRPDRTLVFAAWGAEEYGIFGSSEFVERDRDALAREAVAYINLDMAAMGLKPGGAVSPTLRPAVAAALRAAPGVARDGEDAGSAADIWAKGDDGALRFGDLGGGSDHVAFWCHAGIPSISLSAGGSEGTSYHSNYDTVAWYRAAVGADYASARLVTGIVNAVVATLADARTQHISLTAFLDDCVVQSDRMIELLAARNLGPAGAAADTTLRTMRATFGRMRGFAFRADLRVASAPRATDGDELGQLLRIWTSDAGLEGRPWFRNLVAGTDRDSGYATATWPLLREAILDARADDDASVRRVESAAARYLEAQVATYALIDRLARNNAGEGADAPPPSAPD